MTYISDGSGLPGESLEAVVGQEDVDGCVRKLAGHGRGDDEKERFTFVGTTDPIELEDWKGRASLRFHYARNANSDLDDIMARWATLSSISDKQSLIDSEVKRIVTEDDQRLYHGLRWLRC